MRPLTLLLAGAAATWSGIANDLHPPIVPALGAGAVTLGLLLWRSNYTNRRVR